MRLLTNILFLFCFVAVKAQVVTPPLVANAGAAATVCPNGTHTIGGTPTAAGGNPPYQYTWTPATGLNSTTSANPTATVNQTITYSVVVKDGNDNTTTSQVTLTLNPINSINAGHDTAVCISSNNAQLGNGATVTGSFTYSWSPVDNLSNPTSANPIATPTVTTVYSLTVTSPTCGSQTSAVTVTVNAPIADAGNDTTILEGSTITLHGSGGTTYYWGPFTNIQHQNTANPDVYPTSTQTYYLSTVDAIGCVSYDAVTVTVIENADLYFYNTFTPNGDQNNDTYYIGNLGKYPDNKLEIYNRYGQLVYTKNNYANDWDGKYLGNELPAGTYFYILDTRTDKGKFKGTVTIIR